MPASIRAGDLLAERYRMVDLLNETEGGWFWCAHDNVLQRNVAVHMIAADDERAPDLMEAARRSASVVDRRNLRVLDADKRDGICYVVNEWGQGRSLDVHLANEGPLPPRQAAWIVAQVADVLALAHEDGKAHGRMMPENVLLDDNGQVRVIGFAVDAALHGLPVDSTEHDVRGLAGVLYAALTCKWPGDDASSVPAAPREHGRPLRPRQVRAGIPRALDALCEQVLCADQGQGHGPGLGLATGLTNGLGLGHRSGHDLTTAAGIREALEDFLGDVHTGAVPAVGPAPLEEHRPAEPESGTPESGTPESGTAQSGAPESGTAQHEPVEAPAARPPATSADIPTEAGMPVFHEEDVEWFRARAHKPAPPPAFDEPEERPLFASDPETGEPARRPRAPRAARAGGPDYWPWDTGTGMGSGSGVLAPVPADDVPGRRWLRLGILVGVLALVLLTVVAAYQLGGGGLPGSSDDPDPSPSPEQPVDTPEPYTGLTASDFDPQGDTQEEYPELAPLVVDGDPTTAWRTSTYEQQFGPGGLKTGVGVVVDLGEAKDVSSVAVTVQGGPTTVAVYLSDTPLTGVQGVEPVAAGSGADVIELELEEPTAGRYVTVWLTSIPPFEGDFRGQVAEVVVSG